MNFLLALMTCEVSEVSVFTVMSVYHSGRLDLGTACLYFDEAILDIPCCRKNRKTMRKEVEILRKGT